MTRSDRSPSKSGTTLFAKLPSRPMLQKVVYLLVLGALGWGIVMAVTNWWVCDDAFISFRYAKNLVNGHGLVYNVGERVEGYSNFLWTLLIAGGMKFGANPVPFSVILGLLSLVSVVVASCLVSWRITEIEQRGDRFFLPIAAILILLHHDMQIFSTSGLETMWCTALLMVAFVVLIRARTLVDYLVSGGILTAAALARPDGLLFAAMGGLYVLVMDRRIKAVLAYVTPLIVLYLPYWIIRYQYYGFPFPNTYYAKSGGLPYWSQGWTYLWLYLKMYYALFLVPLCIVLIAWMTRRKQMNASTPTVRAFVLALFFMVPYLLYIVRVGGDFMFGRFWIVITPLLFLLLEIAVKLTVRKPWLAFAATVLLAATVVFRIDLFADNLKGPISGIAYEPAYYPRSQHEQAKEMGLKLRDYFASSNVRVAFFGQYAMHMYYAEVPTAIEAATGLTDTSLAHMPIEHRGRPGHEKTATIEYLQSRQVHFLFTGMEEPQNLADTLTRISFGTLNARIIRYDATMMNRLRKFPGITFIDVPKFIDQFLIELPQLGREVAEISYQFFKPYYFEATRDPARESAYIVTLANLRKK